MSDKNQEQKSNADIASFFEKEQQKKKVQKKPNQQTQNKAADQKNKEEGKASKTETAVQNDYESSDEEDIQGGLEIGVGKAKDIKEVQRQKKEAQAAQRENDFKWFDMGGQNKSAGAAQQQEQKKGGQQFARGTDKEGITFKGKPTFKKSEHVGNKSDFPELGLEQQEEIQKKQQQQSQTKANYGGPVGQTGSAPVGTKNKFDRLAADEKPKEAQEEKKTVEAKGPPKFTGGSGLKKMLQQQSEANAEANVGLEEYKKKLEATIVIHEAKPPRKEQTDQKQDDDEFDQKVEEKKRGGDHRGGRGGFRGRGRARGEEGEHQQEERREGGERGGYRGRGRGGERKDEDRPHTFNKGERFDKGEKKSFGDKKPRRDDQDQERKEQKETVVPQPKPEVKHPEAKITEPANWGAFKLGD